MTEANLMIKAVFWDMDGTLIDSEPYWHEGEMKIAAAHGGYWDEELAWQGSGTPVPDVARRMVEHGCQLSIEEIGQGMIDYVAQKEFECIPWIEGVEDVLVALRDAGVPSMLVTTSPRHLAENLVAQAPAGAFAGYVCGDDDVEKKPSPAPYLEAGRRLGIAPEDIFKILKERNLVSDEGWIGIGGEWLPIKMDAGGITPEAIRHIVISRRTDSLITLGDVATVTLSKKEPPPEMLFFNGEPAVGIGISTVSGGNVVKMGESIQKKLAELAPVFPAEMKLHTISMQSDSVSRAVRGFVENLAEAVAIVIVVLLIFMGFKSGLLIGFVLLLTICGTLMVMNTFQASLRDGGVEQE